ncbi:unnamed protein product [Rangifer tarandus platyrhynchus]|uniref:Uncharacterized protein n=1 Tax=Rangifer tarandus platyrhynchus TaxID=3082113 RepID=A0AC59ZK24_RANTA
MLSHECVCMLEPRTCLRSGFFCIYRMFDCLVVLGSGPLCLPVSLPAVSGSRRALWSTPAGCTPTGVAFAVEPSQLEVGTSLHFSGIQRGSEWTGGVSADKRQDAGVLQPSSLWWGTEG